MKLTKAGKKIYFLFLLLAIQIGFTISFLPLRFGLFPITFDQGRDFLWVRNQFEFRRPSLVGPWASSEGIYFGPLWFWLLGIPYWLSGGHPLAMAVFNWLVVFGAVMIGTFLLKKISKRLAYFFLFCGFLSSAIHGISGYPFSQHLLPLLTILLIYSYYRLLKESSVKHFYLSLFWIGLMFHAEPPISVLSFPSLLLIASLAQKRKRLLNLKVSIGGFLALVIPFLPQIIFDWRHGFFQLQSIIDFILNRKGAGLVDSFQERLTAVPSQFLATFRLTVFQQPAWAGMIILLAIFYINFRSSHQQKRILWQVSLIYSLSLFLSFLFYGPLKLKNFYLDGLIIVYLLWLALALSSLWAKKSWRLLIVVYLLLAFYQNMSPVYFLRSLKNGFADKYDKGSIFANQKRAVEWIYQDAGNRGFKVYTYDPAIYDYPYQYLFFWLGLKKFGYLPEEFAYLPDQPEYVPRKKDQLARLKDKLRKSEGLVYLIIVEADGGNIFKNWRANFPDEKLKLVDRKPFPGRIRVEKRRSDGL